MEIWFFKQKKPYSEHNWSVVIWETAFQMSSRSSRFSTEINFKQLFVSRAWEANEMDL